MKTTLLLLLLWCSFCYSADILVMLPLPTFSHSIGYFPVFEELARRGHNVTVVSPFPRKEPHPNYRDIVITNTASQSLNWDALDLEYMKSYFLALVGYSFYCSMFVEPVHPLPELQAFIREDRSHFDLVITETFFCQEAFSALAHKYSAHHIAVHPLLLGAKEAYYTGNTVPYSYVPHMDVAATDHMSFKERAFSSLIHLSQFLLSQFLYLPYQEKLMNQYFKYPGYENRPPFDDLLRNHSLIMLDYHRSMSTPRPYLQNVVELGGLSLKLGKPLPKDLEEYMSGAKDGVIFFSWGSLNQLSNLPEEILNKFLYAFSKMKQRVLIKWDKDVLPGKPENVKIAKWLPQPSILAHPNLVVFISHCGTHGFNEATYYGVPILGVPIYGDQVQNSKLIEQAGYGIHIDLDDFTKEDVLESLQKLVYNDSYKKAAIRKSNIMKDREISALDNGVYWIEYVLRHDGAKHLRPASLDLAWYQYFLLDIIALFLLIALVCCVLLYYQFRCLYYLIKWSVSSRKTKRD